MCLGKNYGTYFILFFSIVIIAGQEVAGKVTLKHIYEIAQIKSKMANGIRYIDSATGQPQQLSLSAIGMDLQLDGTIKFNSITHAQSVVQGLQAKLAQGGRIGYVDATNDLSTFLRSEISFSGDINSQINAQKANVQDMQKRQAQL
jgi:hypothetical protein